ncbi:MAG: hypothetical protein ABH883_03055, partial [Candidatus Omnitrophota bacterium]
MRDIGIIKYYIRCLSTIYPYPELIPGDVNARIERINADIHLGFSSPGSKIRRAGDTVPADKRYIIPCKVNNAAYYAYLSFSERARFPEITVFTETEFTSAPEKRHFGHGARDKASEKNIFHEETIDTPLSILHGDENIKKEIRGIPPDIKTTIKDFFRALGGTDDLIDQIEDFISKNSAVSIIPGMFHVEIMINGRNTRIPVTLDTPHASNNYINIPVRGAIDTESATAKNRIAQILVHELSAKCLKPCGFNAMLDKVFVEWAESGRDIAILHKYPEIGAAVRKMAFRDLSSISLAEERDYSKNSEKPIKNITTPSLPLSIKMSLMLPLPNAVNAAMLRIIKAVSVDPELVNLRNFLWFLRNIRKKPLFVKKSLKPSLLEDTLKALIPVSEPAGKSEGLEAFIRFILEENVALDIDSLLDLFPERSFTTGIFQIIERRMEENPAGREMIILKVFEKFISIPGAAFASPGNFLRMITYTQKNGIPQNEILPFERLMKKSKISFSGISLETVVNMLESGNAGLIQYGLEALCFLMELDKSAANEAVLKTIIDCLPRTGLSDEGIMTLVMNAINILGTLNSDAFTEDTLTHIFDIMEKTENNTRIALDIIPIVASINPAAFTESSLAYLLEKTLNAEKRAVKYYITAEDCEYIVKTYLYTYSDSFTEKNFCILENILARPSVKAGNASNGAFYYPEGKTTALRLFPLYVQASEIFASEKKLGLFIANLRYDPTGLSDGTAELFFKKNKKAFTDKNLRILYEQIKFLIPEYSSKFVIIQALLQMAPLFLAADIRNHNTQMLVFLQCLLLEITHPDLMSDILRMFYGILEQSQEDTIITGFVHSRAPVLFVRRYGSIDISPEMIFMIDSIMNGLAGEMRGLTPASQQFVKIILTLEAVDLSPDTDSFREISQQMERDFNDRIIPALRVIEFLFRGTPGIDMRIRFFESEYGRENIDRVKDLFAYMSSIPSHPCPDDMDAMGNSGVIMYSGCYPLLIGSLDHIIDAGIFPENDASLTMGVETGENKGAEEKNTVPGINLIPGTRKQFRKIFSEDDENARGFDSYLKRVIRRISLKTSENEYFGGIIDRLITEAFDSSDERRNEAIALLEIAGGSLARKALDGIARSEKNAEKENGPAYTDLIGKYHPLDEVDFIYDKARKKYKAGFQAVDLETGKKETIVLYARKAPSGTFEKCLALDMPNEMRERLKSFLKVFPRDKRYLIEPNFYGIHGLASCNALAIETIFEKEEIPLFHETAVAAGIDPLPYINGGEAALKKYIHSGKNYWQHEYTRLHYAFRLFQRQYWPKNDKRLTKLIRKASSRKHIFPFKLLMKLLLSKDRPLRDAVRLIPLLINKDPAYASALNFKILLRALRRINARGKTYEADNAVTAILRAYKYANAASVLPDIFSLIENRVLSADVIGVIADGNPSVLSDTRRTIPLITGLLGSKNTERFRTGIDILSEIINAEKKYAALTFETFLRNTVRILETSASQDKELLDSSTALLEKYAVRSPGLFKLVSNDINDLFNDTLRKILIDKNARDSLSARGQNLAAAARYLLKVNAAFINAGRENLSPRLIELLTFMLMLNKLELDKTARDFLAELMKYPEARRCINDKLRESLAASLFMKHSKTGPGAAFIGQAELIALYLDSTSATKKLTPGARQLIKVIILNRLREIYQEAADTGDKGRFDTRIDNLIADIQENIIPSVNIVSTVFSDLSPVRTGLDFQKSDFTDTGIAKLKNLFQYLTNIPVFDGKTHLEESADDLRVEFDDLPYPLSSLIFMEFSRLSQSALQNSDIKNTSYRAKIQCSLTLKHCSGKYNNIPLSGILKNLDAYGREYIEFSSVLTELFASAGSPDGKQKELNEIYLDLKQTLTAFFEHYIKMSRWRQEIFWGEDADTTADVDFSTPEAAEDAISALKADLDKNPEYPVILANIIKKTAAKLRTNLFSTPLSRKIGSITGQLETSGSLSKIIDIVLDSAEQENT